MFIVAFGLGMALAHTLLAFLIGATVSIHGESLLLSPYTWLVPVALGVIGATITALGVWCLSRRGSPKRGLMLGAIVTMLALLTLQVSAFFFSAGGISFAAWAIVLAAGAFWAPVFGAPRSNYVLQRTRDLTRVG